MRIAILGQPKFGKSVLEAFASRGDTVAGGAPDPLRSAAESLGIPVHQLPSLRTAEARDILRGMAVDLGVMAYVLQFVPQDLASIPGHGTTRGRRALSPCIGPAAFSSRGSRRIVDPTRERRRRL
jgi:methionyl-tRNA formyltransferase